MPTLHESVLLAREMVRIGKLAGRRMMALVTDMDQPLGHNIGNALEIVEAADILKGCDHGRASQLCLEVAARMVMLCFGSDHETAHAQVHSALVSGAGLKKLGQMLREQGGNSNVLQNYALLPAVAQRVAVRAEQDGFISSLQAQKLGLAAKAEVMGDIMSDLPGRRGLIMGSSSEAGFQKIQAKVPLKEMESYSTALSSFTGGRASFSMKFASYELVPSDVQDKLLKEYAEKNVEE